MDVGPGSYVALVTPMTLDGQVRNTFRISGFFAHPENIDFVNIYLVVSLSVRKVKVVVYQVLFSLFAGPSLSFSLRKFACFLKSGTDGIVLSDRYT